MHAMASGTPIVALPLHPEQDLDASLIEKQGAGHRMTFADAATPRLATHSSAACWNARTTGMLREHSGALFVSRRARSRCRTQSCKLVA